MLPALRTGLPFSSFASSPFNRWDSVFDRFFGDDGGFGMNSAWTGSAVPMSMWQDDNNIYVEAELPGVTEKDVEITVHSGVLTLKAERQAEEGRTYLYNGRNFGRYERAVVLPEAVDSDHVEATLTNGILRITLPKLPEARPRKIALKTS